MKNRKKRDVVDEMVESYRDLPDNVSELVWGDA